MAVGKPFGDRGHAVTDLPEEIEAFLKDGIWTPITIGQSGAKTFRIDQAGAQSLFLKIAAQGELVGEKERNLNRLQLTDLFFEVYGLTDPDWSKIEYYRLLDEFF